MAYCPNCGSPLNENSEICPQCGGSSEQPIQQANTEQPHESRLFNVPKKAWRIIVPVVILVIFGFTCPSKEKHIEAIHTELMDYIEKESGSEAAIYASLGAGIIDKVLVSRLDVNNYVLFSTGSLKDGEKRKMVSLGILGHVFTFGLDKETLGDMKKANKPTAL
ncbi:DUF4359 domain-containing protein [Prevotella intermedia]|uniref:DUF4359 domain-containing protein n=1 Tax=Prevotella intermedia TaxID=28131 RepID=A0AAJ3VA51_PREIN|nr:DUF4359 domain-containing protein [Prevotella intermedia]ATV37401.1 DUF4359 domain-containing protein [Prevotella intermedia]PIK18897.1 DUF4359 domain-containing protein [Prevotella intermedia]